jgi:hypothetical protein
MVSYYYVQALAKALAPARVLLEVPVTGRIGRGRDNHVDALVFNDRELLVAEFKRAWTPSHWGDLARDLGRLRGPVAREIGRGFVDGRRRRSFILLGADCWYLEFANAWKSGESVRRWIFLVHSAEPIGVLSQYMTGPKGQTLMGTTLRRRCFHTMKWPLDSTAHSHARGASQLISPSQSRADGCGR